MKKILIISLSSLFLFAVTAMGQLTPPKVQSVFGGRVNAITGFSLSPTMSRIFISTKSANSIFFADVNFSGLQPSFGQFKELPSANASAGFGADIKYLAAYQKTFTLFFVANGNLYSSNSGSATALKTFSGNVTGLAIDDNLIFFIDSDKFYYGTASSAGAFVNGAASPFKINSVGNDNSIVVDKSTKVVYIFSRGNSPKLFKTSVPYTSFSPNTSIVDITPYSLPSNVRWLSFGIAPDGVFFMMGTDGANKYCATSTNSGSSWSYYNIQIPGVYIDGGVGENIAFSGTSNSYTVFTSNIFNPNKGNSSDWKEFGTNGYETHPNDGVVFVDPTNDRVTYLTTDQGLGASTDGGYTIFEINNGITAVQVNDFWLDANKNKGWLASKSGIRRVDNFSTSPVWSNSMFPLGDGSPYYAVEGSSANPDVAYAGNLRIYKTTDAGNKWKKVFAPNTGVWNFPETGTKINAIAECPYKTNFVMAGFELMSETEEGGLFFSPDGGTSWQQVLIESAQMGQDVDVSDIVFNLENNNIVAYVSVKAINGRPGYSVYRLEWNGTNWSVAQDMNANNTSVGYNIVASIYDLEINKKDNIIIAGGIDIGNTNPVAYYKTFSPAGKWTPLPVSVLSLKTGEPVKAVAYGKSIVYCAIKNEIYYYNFLNSGSSWQLGYSYPEGTEINVLYYDDLVAGTSIGFYEHAGQPLAVKTKDNIPVKFNLAQNYPNPFGEAVPSGNTTTRIEYSIPSLNNATGSFSSHIVLKIFDILGREITTLVNTEQNPGKYSVDFNASKLSAGIYLYKLTVTNSSGKFSDVKKMILLK